MKKGLLLISLGIIVLSGLNIKSDEKMMEEIIVTATREEKPLKDAPGAVTVITRDDIERKNALDITKVLEDKTSLRILRYGALGSSATVQMRGLYGRHVLVMIDNRIINSPATGEADLSSLSTDNVERIEIVRGPSSALYGSNAVSGVVNIITKKPSEKPIDFFSASYGTYQTAINQLSSTAKIDNFGYFFSGNYKSSQGHRDNSAYHSGDSNLKMDYKLSAYSKLLLDIGNCQDKTESPGAQPAEERAKRTESQLILGNSKVSTTRDFNTKNRPYVNNVFNLGSFKMRNYFNLSDDDNHREWMSFGAHFTEDTNYRTISYGSEIMNYWEFSKERRLTLGFNADWNRFQGDKEEVDVTNSVTTPLEWDSRRGNYAAFLQNELNLGKVLVTIGGRWDNPTDFDSQFSGKGNLLWHINNTTDMRLSAGDSYRAPSLNDLNWPKDNFSEGNPNLLPEKSHSYELGLKRTFEGLKLVSEINIFYQVLDGMIAWAPTGTMGPWGNRWMPDNVNQAWIQGLEFINSLPLNNYLSFHLNYTFLNAHQRNQELRDSVTNRIESETRKLAYTPSHKLDSGVTFNNLAGIEKLYLDLNAQYNSATYQYYSVYAAFPDTSVTTEPKRLNGYWLANLKLRKSIENMEFSVGVENMTDKQYAVQFGSSLDDHDYPMPGRMVLGGMSVKF